MDKQEMGILIKTKRTEKKIRQKKLAELLNVTEAAVSKWENGKNFPDVQTWDRLSKILDIPIERFLDCTASDQPPLGNISSADKDIMADDPKTDNIPSAEMPPAPLESEPDPAASEHDGNT